MKLPRILRKVRNDSPIHFESTSRDSFFVVLKDISIEQKNVYRCLKAFGKKIPRHEIEMELEKSGLRVEGSPLENPVVKDFFVLIISKVKWVAFVESKVPIKVLSKRVNCVEFVKINDCYRVNIEIVGTYIDRS
jgi:hypothetical protein